MAIPFVTYGQTARPDSTLPAAQIQKGDSLAARLQFDSSLTCYQEAAKLTHDSGDWEVYLRSLNSIADVQRKAEHVHEALGTLRIAEEIGRNKFHGESLECAATDDLLGYILAYLDSADTAIEYCRHSIKIRQEKAGVDHPLVATSYQTLALAMQKKGEFSDALHYLREALRIQSSAFGENSRVALYTLATIGMTHSAMSATDSAAFYLESVLWTLREQGQEQSPLAVSCNFYLCGVYAEKGDNAMALKYGQASLSMARALYGELNGFVIGCYGRMGVLYSASGDYDRAIDLFNEGLLMAKRLNNELSSGTAWFNNQLSSIYREENQPDRALALATEALAIQQKALGGHHPEVAFSLENIGAIYADRGDSHKALGYFGKAIALRESVPGGTQRPDLARLELERGKILAELGDTAKAREALSRSINLQGNLSDLSPLLIARTNNALGDLSLREKDYAGALNCYQLAIQALCPDFHTTDLAANPSLEGVADWKMLFQTLSQKALTLRKLSTERNGSPGDLEAALSTYETAAQLADHLRKSYHAEGSKYFLQADASALYENAIETSLQLFGNTRERRFLSEAFAFAERTKAAVLMEGIFDAAAKQYAGIPDSLLEQERSLRESMTFCEQEMLKGIQPEGNQERRTSRSLQNALYATRIKFQDLLDRYERDYPTYYKLRYKDRSVALSDLQDSLDAGSCVLEYVLGARTMYVFAVTHDSCAAMQFPRPENIDLLAEQMRTAIKTFEGAEYFRTSRALYNVLIHPVNGLIAGKEHLIIIPDGTLYEIPFEAMIAQDLAGPGRRNNGSDFSSPEYLIKSHAISYSFSSTFYLNELTRGLPAIQSGNLAAFAPVFRDATGKSQLLANRGPAAERAIAEVRSITLDGRHFNELPYTEEEARSIVSGFEMNGKEAIGYFNNDATEEAFKQNAGKYAFLHIATHGYINEDHPNLSALLFAKAGNSTSTEDGVLYAGETYGLRLNADLVVLSSCESGVGTLVKGEGMMAVTRGFFYAGARNIVFSLWKVYDDVTKTLMINFYDNTLNGKTYSAALRNAKLEMISNPATAFPSKWAGFVLMGR